MPTLQTLEIDAEGFLQKPSTDPTLRSQQESGKVITRARFTAVPKMWEFTSSRLSNTDKITLENFERDTVNYGALNFDWTNPIDSVVYNVRFAAPIDFLLDNNLLKEWNVRVILQEIL